MPCCLFEQPACPYRVMIHVGVLGLPDRVDDPLPTSSLQRLTPWRYRYFFFDVSDSRLKLRVMSPMASCNAWFCLSRDSQFLETVSICVAIASSPDCMSCALLCVGLYVSKDDLETVEGYCRAVGCRDSVRSCEVGKVNDLPLNGLTGVDKHLVCLLTATTGTHRPSIVWWEVLRRRLRGSLPRNDDGATGFPGRHFRAGEFRLIGKFVYVGRGGRC